MIVLNNMLNIKFSLIILFTSLLLVQCKEAYKVEADLATDEELTKQLAKLPDSLFTGDHKSLFYAANQATYYGRNRMGNKVAMYALSKMDSVTGEILHHFSVQNTKNGNYILAIDALEKAVVKDPDINGYYGWLLLYYYRDYERALQHLESYDSLTPNFSDAPVGEDINYLKGLAYAGLDRHEEALVKFDKYINEITSVNGEDWVDVYAFVNKGLSLAALTQFENAISAYDKAILNYPKCTEAYFHKAMANQKLGNLSEAKKLANLALDLAKVGYKHTDVYVALPDEVYQGQIEEFLAEL